MTSENMEGETKKDDSVQEQPKRKPRRIIRRRRQAQENQVKIDEAFLEKVVKESGLPPAYNFELRKSIERIHSMNAKHVALQMPEGLLMYATVLADFFKRMTPFLEEVSILGDVTYGACCVDDLGARALGAELLVHYGHSCLVPIQHTVIPCLYVFVELQIDVKHLVDCVKASLEQPEPLALLGTIQFRQALVEAQHLFQEEEFASTLPQVKPLSPGEVLGCTSPVVLENIVVFCADGRFHLESCMIQNPHVKRFLRYDPYSKTLTDEKYGHAEMHKLRKEAISQASHSQVFGIVLGTLGRQGNPGILQQVKERLRNHGKKSFVMLLSEISPTKLALLPQIDAWVQIACPRLSVDWGHYFLNSVILTPYELHVMLGETQWTDVYPMDFYANRGGPWANYHEENKSRTCSRGKEAEEGCDSGVKA